MKPEHKPKSRALPCLLASVLALHLIYASDVAEYSVAKGLFFNQTSTASPSPPSSSGFVFQATVDASVSGAVLGASVTIPSGSNRVLSADGPTGFLFEQFFNSRPPLDSTYATGSYTFAIATLNDGTNMPALTLTTNHYPNSPRITNWAAAQLINAGADFTVAWNAFTDGTNSDFIALAIRDGASNEVFHSGPFGSPGALNGTNRSGVIPANTLSNDQTYQARLVFLRVLQTDTNAIPGAPGLAGLFSETRFGISTFTNTSSLAVMPTTLSNAEIGVSYSATLAVTGGLPPYVISPDVVLPNSMEGLTLRGGTNVVLLGTPLRPYNPSPKTIRSKKASFTMMVTDQLGAGVTNRYKLRIYDPVSIDTARLPNAVVSNAYNAKLKAINGVKPYLWSASNSLPTGLSLDATNGIITGMAQASGTFSNVIIHVSDSLGGRGQRMFTVEIE